MGARTVAFIVAAALYVPLLGELHFTPPTEDCDSEADDTLNGATLQLLQQRLELQRSRRERVKEANPPVWPPSVQVFSPGDSREDIEKVFYQLTSELIDHHTGHFSSKRFAFLFKPGRYHVNLTVGYYVQVLGLGADAQDVVFEGAKGVWAPAADPWGAGSLDTFWRGAENFRTEASDGMRWAVSQAAPLRRLEIKNKLILHDCGHGPHCFASGGFISNLVIGGEVDFGSQQQWFSRNVEFQQGAAQGAWNFVFVGCTGAPESAFQQGDHKSISNIARAPVKAEKPFITIDSGGRYTLRIPGVEVDSRGAVLKLAQTTVRSVPFEEVYVARDVDDTQKIQSKLDDGYHLVLTPGIYNLTSSLTVWHPGQTLLGLGMATLISPRDGTPCIRVLGEVPGVRVAGVMLGASVPAPGAKPSSLLEWGVVGDEGDPEDPGFLFDIFARVDNADAETGTVLKVNSGNVIGDHLWLWRADHAKLMPGEEPGWLSPDKRSEYHLVRSHEAKAQHGLEVFGNDVVMYGLQVEHFLQDQTVWYGERGMTFFYQCELPYDVSQASFADQGYAGYKVLDNVSNHTAYGLGVYSFFRDADVLVPTAVLAPKKETVHMVNIFTRFLNGHGGIQSVMGYHDGKSLVKEGAKSVNGTPTDKLLFGFASVGQEIQDLLSEMKSQNASSRARAITTSPLPAAEPRNAASRFERSTWVALFSLACGGLGV
eukprot:TRINITY_DN9257_c0_g1_i1.p1 TRINITY_DN9257_c0_g1~~TRINITY_DN9257_c0_g1_i1.p1  ORF type:complete len:711 (-),score=135.61 TRINITY_DN9257_c0_g1_i1:81-2213(-)